MTEIVDKGGRKFVLVPLETYERMIDELDELDDIRAYDRANSEPREFVPLTLVKRIFSGENRILVWREHRGLTQQQLADETRLSRTFISQLETGARQAALASLQRIAAALCVDLDDLLPRGDDTAEREGGLPNPGEPAAAK